MRVGAQGAGRSAAPDPSTGHVVAWSHGRSLASSRDPWAVSPRAWAEEGNIRPVSWGILKIHLSNLMTHTHARARGAKALRHKAQGTRLKAQALEALEQLENLSTWALEHLSSYVDGYSVHSQSAVKVCYELKKYMCLARARWPKGSNVVALSHAPMWMAIVYALISFKNNCFLPILKAISMTLIHTPFRWFPIFHLIFQILKAIFSIFRLIFVS